MVSSAFFQGISWTWTSQSTTSMSSSFSLRSFRIVTVSAKAGLADCATAVPSSTYSPFIYLRTKVILVGDSSVSIMWLCLSREVRGWRDVWGRGL